MRRPGLPQRWHHRGVVERAGRGAERRRLQLPDGLREHPDARRRHSGARDHATPARTLPVQRALARRAEKPAADARYPEQCDLRDAATAQGLHAPGRQDLRRTLLGRRFPGGRRVHPAQARRSVPALRPPLQGGRVMSRARGYARVVRVLLVVALGLTIAGTFAVLERTRIGGSMERRQRWSRWFMARLTNALPFRVTVTGQLPTQPMLWVSNHVSWTDIALLGMLAPLSFLSKAEVRTWPVAGWLALKAGTLFIRRGSGDSRLIQKQMCNHLQQGNALLIFPEGTTTDGRSLRTFHGRLLSSAIEAGVPIQPVAISYSRDGKPDPIAPFIGDDDLLSHLRRLFANEQSDVHIHLLTPIPTADQERAALAFKAQQAVQVALFGEPVTGESVIGKQVSGEPAQPSEVASRSARAA
ncbi:1-acyl-sn-glycerol-3-phosphate acyltransferase [Pseudomonas amygdali pv. mellea]|nr:1-acyl-sn-glycerol-3-phosphate acyltransferase [Pseudomonas amygdali pv. mellea]